MQSTQSTVAEKGFQGMRNQHDTRHVPERWPALPLAEWQSTLDTLHMWLQVIGKITLELTPYRNQWWHIGLHPTARHVWV